MDSADRENVVRQYVDRVFFNPTEAQLEESVKALTRAWQNDSVTGPVQVMREHLERLQEASNGEDIQAQLAAFSAALDVALSRWPEIEEPYAY